MLSRFHPIPGRYGRTERVTIYQRQHARVNVLTRDKKRIIPAIITGRISSFFLMYYTPYSLCLLDGGPPTKTLCQKLGGPDPLTLQWLRPWRGGDKTL